MTKAGAGRFLIAIVLVVFTFANVASAKSRVTHNRSKQQRTHRQLRVARKTGKERPAGRHSRLAHKTSKERPAGRHSRLAYNSSKKHSAGRQYRVAQRTSWEQPAERQSNNQIVWSSRQTAPEAKTSSVAEGTVQTPRPAEPQIDPDLENAVIPPAPVVVKRIATAILIPVEVASSGSKAQSDLRSDSKPESKYEERLAVSSSVSVGSAFGYRRDPFTRRAKFHSGVDLKARWGDAVGASQAGIVQFAGWYHGYGNMIIVDHGGGVTTHYAHLSSFDVEPGAHVERGTIIGRAGSTGRATSPHLHYEVRVDGMALDPLQPLALDPSSDYFKLLRLKVDAGRGNAPSTAASSQDK